MPQSPLDRYLELRAPTLLASRNVRLTSALGVRAYHLIVGAGATVWIGSILGNYPNITQVGPALVGTGFVMRYFVRKIHDAAQPLINPTLRLDDETEALLARLAGSDISVNAAWQRVIAPPTAVDRLDRVLTPETRNWLENGAASTNRILGTLQMLGPDHPFAVRSAPEIERAVDFGMIQLLRRVMQVEKYPDTLPQVNLESGRILERLSHLADVVDTYVRPKDRNVQIVTDPLERAIEDLSLDGLVKLVP